MEYDKTEKIKDPKKKKLILVTNEYPWGFGEKIFLSAELEELVAHYDVTIISNAGGKKFDERMYDSRFENQVRFFFYDWTKRHNLYQKLLGAMRSFFSLTFLKELIRILKAKKQLGTRIFDSLYFYRKSQRFYKWIKGIGVLNQEEDIIYYTYWSTFYTLALLKNRKKYKNIKIVSRLHRDDLYEGANRGNWQPFKVYMDKRIDKCLFVARTGYEYYKQTFVRQLDFNIAKYAVCKLGTKPYYVRNPEEAKEDKAFRLVSCSNVIPVKRVEFIVRALSCIKQEKIEWIHFGAGNAKEEINGLAEELLSKKENICYKFMGYCENEKIMEFYGKNHVDCFITTSSSEGLPVSIMEALSMGIPIIGTDVGGICECIDGNGILLKETPKPQEIADSILKLYYMSQNEMKKMREKSYALFQREYNAEVNAKRVVEILEKL